MDGRPAGLYIHIPFCRSKCFYCDFNSVARLEDLHEPYIVALCAEIKRFTQHQNRVDVDTIYLGGGTPTCLQPALLAQILKACLNAFQVSTDAEISIEANPGTLTAHMLTALASAGVNRLSLGAQSLRDDELRLLGRIHSAAETHEAVRLARSAGIANVSLDLIYGLPRQTLLDWCTTLEEALVLEPEHLSLYALSLEEGTPLAKSVKNGDLPDPDPDLAADMYMAAGQRLNRAGYIHYELSNWARRRTSAADNASAWPGKDGPPAMCRHNLKYWKREPYVGFGAGAHSFYANWRYHNTPKPQDYLLRMAAENCAVESQNWIGPDEAMAETMILGLRLIDGVRFDQFEEQHHHDLRQQYGAAIDELQMLGLLKLGPAGVRLTPRGLLLANQVFSRFWPVSDPESKSAD